MTRSEMHLGHLVLLYFNVSWVDKEARIEAAREIGESALVEVAQAGFPLTPQGWKTRLTRYIDARQMYQTTAEFQKAVTTFLSEAYALELEADPRSGTESTLEVECRAFYVNRFQVPRPSLFDGPLQVQKNETETAAKKIVDTYLRAVEENHSTPGRSAHRLLGPQFGS